MDFIEIKRKIIGEISTALDEIEGVDILVEEIISSKKIFIVGAGRAKLMIEAFAKRLGHLGVNVHVVGEIVQPPASKGDLLIVASGSGGSVFPLSIAQKAKKMGVNVVSITACKNSKISEVSNSIIYIPAKTKSFSHKKEKSSQPLGNLFEQSLLIYCDIVAMLIQEKKGLLERDLREKHTNLE